MIDIEKIAIEMARNERNKLREKQAIDKLKKKLVENEITETIYRELKQEFKSITTPTETI